MNMSFADKRYRRKLQHTKLLSLSPCRFCILVCVCVWVYINIMYTALSLYTCILEYIGTCTPRERVFNLGCYCFGCHVTSRQPPYLSRGVFRAAEIGTMKRRSYLPLISMSHKCYIMRVRSTQLDRARVTLRISMIFSKVEVAVTCACGNEDDANIVESKIREGGHMRHYCGCVHGYKHGPGTYLAMHCSKTCHVCDG